VRLPDLLSKKVYETHKKIMTTNQTPERRGGSRENAGRVPDYQKRCQIYAIQLAFACSETTARRTFRDWNGNMDRIMGNHQYAKALEGWGEMSEFAQGMVYGILQTLVEHMLEQGFGRRL